MKSEDKSKELSKSGECVYPMENFDKFLRSPHYNGWIKELTYSVFRRIQNLAQCFDSFETWQKK